MFENGGLSLAVTTVAATAIVAIFFWRRKNGTKDGGKRYPPSSPVLPLIGAIIRGGVEVLPDHFMKSAEKLGPVISYGFRERLLIILNGKEAISDAFLRKSEAFADRAEFWAERNLFNPNLKGIIFARYNDTFKKYHKLCLTIFKEFGFGVNSVSETRILHEVESLTAKILQYNGRPFDPKPLNAEATFNVVSSIMFGQTFVSTDACRTISQRVPEFASNTDFAINFAPFLRFLPSIRKKCSILVKCHEDIVNGIEKGIGFSKPGDCESSFVKRFIEIQGSDYDQQDLLFILRDLCFASADTVSTTVTWATAELANHPDVLTRFQREIDDVVPKDRFPSLDDKQRLPYTEAVILEIMRRHTAIPLYVPHAALKDAEVLGYHVPKGSMVIANAISAHMDPGFWKDPENFRPERFLDEDNSIIGSENVLAFSLGKRSCLGELLGRQKTFLFLTSLVQRFDIRPPEGQDSISVKEIVRGIMHSSPFEVRLIPRTGFKN